MSSGLNFQGDLRSELRNLKFHTSGIGYGNISVLVLVRFWENMTFTNLDNLYIIRADFQGILNFN